MQITFTIPDAVAPRVIAALAQDPAPGETQAQAAKRNVVDYIKRQVAAFEGESARESAIDKADEEISITVETTE